MNRLVPALRQFLAGAGLVALAGCNLAPAYHPPVVTTPAAYKPIEGWSPAAPADDAPRGPWWTVFNDPVLNDLEGRLDAANPDLQAALARYEGARAYALQAKGGLLPSAGVQGTALRNRQSADKPLRGTNQPDNYTADQLNGVASYELDLWGKLHNQWRADKALAQASDEDRAAIQLSLEAQLASDYMQLRGLDADIALLTQTVAAYRKSYDLTRRLYAGKIIAQMDVSRAQVQWNNAQTSAADLIANRDLMANAIAVLLGDNPSTFTLSPATANAQMPAIPEGLPSSLLQRRPDIASAERAAAAANFRIGVARAAFYPSISFDAAGGVMSQGANPFKAADLFWALGPSISLPIFQGGRLKGQLAQARAQFDEASAHYRGVTLNAFKEVEDNRALTARLTQEESFARDASAAAQQTVNAANDLYAQGATSYLDVVTAQTALLQARKDAIDIRTRRFVASVGLIRALGGGWSVSGDGAG
ncbi:efflux transporter outer membrane subunit [Novosphingobium rosa]|uniref:efflux transporter outer membrane subunit n=1 Tax=Novosphingobium rosa TaxID=76978 RepID=UPI0009FE4BA2|nr:efflux transporter outer membrane subunit [Novosphingobium rosa]